MQTTSLHRDKTEYLNMISNQLRMLAIGQFRTPPLLVVVLSQVSREAQNKSEKTKRLTLGSAYACSALEHDCFTTVGVIATAESKQASLINLQLLKNRNKPLDLAPLPCPALFQYCKYGDLSESTGVDDIFNPDSLDDLFDL